MGRIWRWALAGLMLGCLANPRATAQSPLSAAPADPVIPQEATWTSPCPLEPEQPRAEGSGLSAGATLYFLKPFFENNTALVTLGGIGTPSASRGTSDFDWNLSAAPAFWVGWGSAGGLGIRGRTFFFDQHSRLSTASLTAAQAVTTAITPPSPLDVPVVPGAASFFAPGIVLAAGLGTDVLAFGSDLYISATDVEATYESRLGNWGLVYSGGGRYLRIAQNYRATLRNQVDLGPAGAVSETQLLSFDHNFDGGGPTAALQARYHFGTGLALYGNVRGSLLVGETHQVQVFQQEVVDPNGLAGGNQLTTPSADTNRNSVLPVFETELGLEWGVAYRRTGVFLRGGAVNQTYFNAGSASQTTGNLSLFGALVTLGLRY